MKEDIKNLKEFKALIKKYRSITPERIENAYKKIPITCGNVFDGGKVAQVLTGFGRVSSCTLCISINKRSIFSPCQGCVYNELTLNDCYRGEGKESYYKIRHTNSPKQLIEAFEKRADYMEDLLIKNELIEPKAKPAKKQK